MTKQILLSDLVKKLNKKKAFAVYKKKITDDDLKLVFTKKEFKKRSLMKNYTLIFGIFITITGFFSIDIARMIVGLVFAFGSLFMENSNKKFLKNKIKKNSEHLLNAYDNGLISFHFMGELGTISKDDTQLIIEDED